ncbi:hypothetical protein 7t3_0140 [Salmonella phage 7t3]|nr:hypothetical protein 7t3_0140 [Salmonella phage 7t3]
MVVQHFVDSDLGWSTFEILAGGWRVLQNF